MDLYPTYCGSTVLVGVSIAGGLQFYPALKDRILKYGTSFWC
jgi:hypothetical protein